MRRKSSPPHYFILFCLSIPLHAQSAAGIIDPSRSIDWSQAGVPGGIPNRTTICATLSPGTTASQINSAIASCPSGQVVFLNAGTYNLSSGITFANHSNVTLRGAGADSTKLVFTGDVGCGGPSASVCLMGSSDYPGSGREHTANWTAGYARGSNQITLSTTSGLSVGSILSLDQLNDSNTETGSVWVCQTQTACATEGPSGAGRSGRTQQQWARVTAINGTSVTITPDLYMPNWRSSQSPGVWWVDSNVRMSGLEDVSLDHTAGGASAGIILFNAYNCWVKGVRSINANRNHVWFWTAASNTIRDSYFYGTKNAQSQSYGVESYTAGDNLIENNIFQHIAEPLMINGEASGSVVSYNYITDNYETASSNSLYGDVWLHSGGIDNMLFEGNIGEAFFSDVIHGTHHFVTIFRSYYVGWETGKNSQTFPIGISSFGRYHNIIGNVLGKAGYHTTYQCLAGSSCSPDVSIYTIGHGDGIADDPKVAATLMRWGNYDTVNGAVRFVSSEVPTGISPYANAVPADHNLPASFYLSGKPGWFGSVAWPPIGPDVTGGNITGVSGHANKVPAQLCFESSPKESNNILTFNAKRCYGQTVITTTVLPPTNLSVVIR